MMARRQQSWPALAKGEECGKSAAAVPVPVSHSSQLLLSLILPSSVFFLSWFWFLRPKNLCLCIVGIEVRWDEVGRQGSNEDCGCG